MNVFEPGVIGGIAARNRLVRSATYEGKATEDGFPTQAIEDIYLDLARGGVGAIITSYTYIASYEQPRVNQLSINRDELVPAYRELVDKVHGLGAKIVMQIVHGSSWGQAHLETARVLGPSPVVYADSGIVPQEMTHEDMRSVAQLFAEAAVRVKAAGFDGVQLHFAHNYLLSQFASPIYNRRTDEYGGSPENRYRLHREVYQAVRAAVGEYPVWAKMDSQGDEDGGLAVEDFLLGAQGLAELGLDCIEVSGARWRSYGAEDRAYYADGATRLAALVEPACSVVLTGGLRSCEDIERVLAAGPVSGFGFARPFMTNPAFAQELERSSSM